MLSAKVYTKTNTTEMQRHSSTRTTTNSFAVIVCVGQVHVVQVYAQPKPTHNMQIYELAAERLWQKNEVKTSHIPPAGMITTPNLCFSTGKEKNHFELVCKDAIDIPGLSGLPYAIA
jgi:hypothetical protein